mmetsp:Transcript_22106/g.42988  ORF Transcript_22106/g.42988 Transcript_22106/m.42988 type:complete len:200 (+) Transcript_22106:166-765(+)
MPLASSCCCHTLICCCCSSVNEPCIISSSSSCCLRISCSVGGRERPTIAKAQGGTCICRHRGHFRGLLFASLFRQLPQNQCPPSQVGKSTSFSKSSPKHTGHSCVRGRCCSETPRLMLHSIHLPPWHSKYQSGPLLPQSKKLGHGGGSVHAQFPPVFIHSASSSSFSFWSHASLHSRHLPAGAFGRLVAAAEPPADVDA